MPDIHHHLPVRADADRVFEAVATSRGMDAWWTKRASGIPEGGTEFELCFGGEYDWRARVIACVPGHAFELEMTTASNDWRGTRIGFELVDTGGLTEVKFHHRGWPDENEHFRVSTFCWAMYLRLLRRYVENGEVVPYEQRLDA